MSQSYVPSVGGLPVIRPAPLSWGVGEVRGLTLISDTHFGSAMADTDLVRAELETAHLHGDRVLLGGDIFDCILPSDHRRYCPSALALPFRGRDDILNAVTEWATEFFSPYADLIDVVGIGNHETENIRHHNYDPVRQLVKNLNQVRQAKPAIAEAGYTAYVCYPLRHSESTRNRGEYRVWYHHGSGKTASHAQALQSLRRKANFFQADLYWSGHSHSRGNCVERVLLPGPGGDVISRDVRLVVTGSYLHAYGGQGQVSMGRKGRKSNYATEGGYLPTGLGGARVTLEWGEGGPYPDKVRCEQ